MRLGVVGIIAVAFLALEIVGITLVAEDIGVLRTFLWLLAAMVAGAWLIRSAGTGFMPELMQATSNGQDPFAVMWSAGRRFLAGMLLILPGFISDVIALLLLLTAGLPRSPGPSRTAGHEAAGPHAPHRGHYGSGPHDGDVIEGEYRRED
jgi:UPF0716 protein FxsA